MSTTDTYPIYPMAIVLPFLALLSILLDIPPLIWHISQKNIAAWSLILWIIVTNFFLFINPFIWPRDNLLEWYNGKGLCDIQVRVVVGSVIALPCALVCIMRKLAMIMDTRNITIGARTNRRVRENVLEVLWCWGFPVLIMLVYYFVQSRRYFIIGISGCYPVYDASWPSIVAVWMWQPIILTVGSYYAILLLHRLYRYRREFSRLISARDTTKSRFIRLLVMSLLLCFFTIPYAWWMFYTEVKSKNGSYVWSNIHGPQFNSVIKVPSGGQPFYDTWGRIIIGYLIFFVFGTGRDATTLYKKLLLGLGLGHIWPSLHIMEDSSTPRSHSTSSKIWSWPSSKAKAFFTSTTSSAVTSQSMTQTQTQTQDAPRSGSIQPAISMDTVVASQTPAVTPHTSTTKPSFLRRLFSKRPATQSSLLPLHSHAVKKSIDHSELSPTSTYSAGPSNLHPQAHTHAWVEGGVGERTTDTSRGVTVLKEVRQESQVDDEKARGDMA